MTCIYCSYDIEQGVPGHEFILIDNLGNKFHMHEECRLGDFIKQGLEV